MKILYTSDIYGNSIKLQEFLGLHKSFNPTISIINGNIFPYHQLNREEEIVESIKIINQIADKTKLYIQFGGDDFNLLYKKHLSAFINVTDLTNSIESFNEFTLMGINYCPNWWVQERKDWTLRDGRFYKQYVDASQGMISDESNIYQIKNLESHLLSKPTIGEVIEKKLKKIEDIEKTILVTCVPPVGLGLDASQEYLHWGSYSIRRLVEGDFTNGNQPMICFSSGFRESTRNTKNAVHELDKCVCFNCGQSDVALSYIVVDLSGNGISRAQHSLYPMKSHRRFDLPLANIPDLEKL